MVLTRSTPSCWAALLLSATWSAPAAAYTRYHPSDDVWIDPQRLADAEHSTRYARYPIQDAVYGFFAELHVLLVVPIVLLFVWQWARRKGDRAHVRSGRILSRWIMPVFLPAALFLQAYHVLASDPESFTTAPAIFSLELAAAFVTAFGLAVINATVNAFAVGRVIGLERSWIPLAMHALNLTWITVAYVFMVGSVLGGATGYAWEINVEMIIVGAVIPVYELTCVASILRWRRTGHLDWRGHHRMSVTWLTSLSFAAILLFTAHDAYWIFAYPGLELSGRLVPQLLVHGPNLRPIVRFLRGPSASGATATA